VSSWRISTVQKIVSRPRQFPDLYILVPINVIINGKGADIINIIFKHMNQRDSPANSGGRGVLM
jgi:hypothetical protein